MLRKWLLTESTNQPTSEDKSICLTLGLTMCTYHCDRNWKKGIHSIFPAHPPPSLLPQIKTLPPAALPHSPTCFCGWRGHHWLPGKELLPHFLLQLPAVVGNFLGENGHIHSSISISMRSSSTLHHTLTFPPLNWQAHTWRRSQLSPQRNSVCGHRDVGWRVEERLGLEVRRHSFFPGLALDTAQAQR